MPRPVLPSGSRPPGSAGSSTTIAASTSAANERIWFRIRFAHADVEDLYASPDHPGGAEFALADPAIAEISYATYLDEVDHARLVVEGRSLDETFGDETVTEPGWLSAESKS